MKHRSGGASSARRSQRRAALLERRGRDAQGLGRRGGRRGDGCATCEQVREAAEAERGAGAAHGAARATSASSTRCASRSFYAERRRSSRARGRRAVAERERLDAPDGAVRASDIASALPERLPDLPAAPRERRRHRAGRDRAAPRHAARAHARHAERLARVARPHARRRGFVNVLEIGYARNTRDRRAARRRATRSSSSCRSSTGAAPRSRSAEAHLHAGREPRRRGRRSTRARKCAKPTPLTGPPTTLARHYRDEIVPLRKRISEENAAALQRHADQRVRAARRYARAGRERERVRSRRCATSGSPSRPAGWR